MSSQPRRLPVIRLSAVLPFVSYGQGILDGVVRHLNSTGVKWSLRPVSSESRFIKQEIDQWKPHGVFLEPDRAPQAAAQCVASGIPYVALLSGRRNEGNHPMTVSADNFAIGQMAAEYFLDRGYQHFAFAGNRDYDFSLEEQEGYEVCLRRKQRAVLNFVHSTPEFDHARPRIHYQEDLAAWIQELPKPVALFAANDWEALSIVQACASVDVDVPSEVSVLGMGNDRLGCHLCSPEISSIIIPYSQIGMDAAKSLMIQMADEAVPRIEHVHQQPSTVITRGSTKDYAVRDPLVRTGLDYMLANTEQPLKIYELLDRLRVSRPTLEAAFRDEFGHTPLVQFRKLRVERAKMLLVDTDLTNAEIAKASGFSSNVRFIEVFKQLVNTTPAAYRESFLSS